MVNIRKVLSVFFIFCNFLLFSAYAADIKWFSGVNDNIVESSLNYQTLDFDGQGWQGSVANPVDPIIVFKPVSIDADNHKFLYVKLSVDDAEYLKFYFVTGSVFNETESFFTYKVRTGSVNTYCFNLANFDLWKGTVKQLRIDVEGAVKDSVVSVYDVGFSQEPVKSDTDVNIVITNDPPVRPVKSERMAVHHHTLVVADEKRPNTAVMTYALDKPASSGQYVLSKFTPFVGSEPLKFDRGSLVVEDLPGSVTGKYSAGDVTVEYEILPLLVGRETSQQEGVALYRIKTIPVTPVTIRCGNRGLHNPHHPREFLHTDKFQKNSDAIMVKKDIVIFDSNDLPHIVVLRSKGKIKADIEAGFVDVEFKKGRGDIILAYGPNEDITRETVNVEVKKEYKKVKSYYEKLLQAKIETPEKVMNEAFRSAVYNLEYAWLGPFGWIESVHHWHMMWHMQASGAAAWLGQSDRARDCIFSHADRQLENGGAPQLTIAGEVHREIFTGGSNQFYAWQIEQYYRYTNNVSDIEKLGPVLDKVVEQTFEEYDIEGDLLLRWAAQIGNQEDFVHTPYNGTSPTIEGVNMLRTAAKLADARGDRQKAENYRGLIDKALAGLREQLWYKDLGRFVYFRDPLGVVRPDGQYHTYIYSVIYNITDTFDSWTSIRHLRDQLTGENGEVYASNNFPAHGATSGCQAGAAQQPWGAWGLAKMGLRNETYKPLKVVADWVMSDTLRGSWPEISTEPIPAYFSPPAGLYVQSMIEAVFGLQPDVPNGVLKVTPSLPDHWPNAKLNLPDYNAEYTKKNNILEYVVETKQPLARQLRWHLPLSRVKKVFVNGKEADFEVSSAVGSILLSVDTQKTKKTYFKVMTEPIEYSVSYPRSIAEGQDFKIELRGCKPKELLDRSGILSQFKIVDKNTANAVISKDILKPYLKYGRLGQINFSRRTFFVLCETVDGQDFWQPIDLTILPEYETTAAKHIDSDGKFEVLVRNNTFENLKCKAFVEVAQQRLAVELDIAPRSEKKYNLSLDKNHFSFISVGDNNARFVLGDKEILDFTLIGLKLCEAQNIHIKLPDDMLKDPKELDGLRNSYGHDWLGWKRWAPHIEDVNENIPIELPHLPGVSFKSDSSKVVPVSFKSGKPSITLDMQNKVYKKIYLLVIPYLENHETFTPVAEITVRTGDDRFIKRKLYTPGDLDWMRPAHPILTTFRQPRQDRFGLLPILPENKVLWAESKPPAFPQTQFWSTSLVYKTSVTVMNVIELDLEKPVEVKSLNISTIGIDSALSIVAITGQSSNIKKGNL